MAQKLVHCDSASPNAEQFGTSLSLGRHEVEAVSQVCSPPSLRRQVDYAEFFRQKGRGNPAHVSLGNSNALS
jgi:hypothetical protein